MLVRFTTMPAAEFADCWALVAEVAAAVAEVDAAAACVVAVAAEVDALDALAALAVCALDAVAALAAAAVACVVATVKLKTLGSVRWEVGAFWVLLDAIFILLTIQYFDRKKLILYVEEEHL
jgi:hypothetical protein